ncbi:MAG TPA: hypothetical protein VN802_09190 [Stellaceae bacterium]|nr:hypothetical protein [Stellaceae bacterium]
MGRPRHAIAALAFLALAPWPSPAVADDVAIRAGAHGGYGRIAFDWPAAIAYKSHVDNETLTIRFARPLGGEPEALRTMLADYVASAALENQGKTVVIHLTRPMKANVFTVRGKIVVVDLMPGAATKTAAKSRPAKTAEAKPAPKPAPFAVRLSAAKKDGAQRVTFAWPRAVEYDFAETDGVAQLSFFAAGTIDQAALARLLPDLAPKVETSERSTIVALTVPAGVHLTASHAEKSVTLELSAAPPPPPAQAAEASPAPAPAAPADAAPASQIAAAPESEPAAPPPSPPPASVAVHLAVSDAGTSLRFDWPVATGAAMFRRGADLWVVFATPTALDLAEANAHLPPALTALAQVAMKDATVLRLAAAAGIEPAVRRAGTAWILDLKPASTPADAPIVVESHPDSTPANVVFRVHQASPAVTVEDAELGRVIVVPVGEVARGLAEPPDFVDFRALPSAQGLVLRPFVDDLALHVAEDGVEVTRAGGLELSSDRDRLLGHRPEAVHTLFDFAAWRGPKGVDYTDRRAALERAIADVPLNARTEPRLALARFYFSHRFAAETLAVLEAVAHDDPQQMDAPQVHALKGAACLLVEDRKCATDELGHHGLDGDPEAALWRASLASASDDEESAAKGFLESVSLLPGYPRPLRARFALEAARAMLESGRTALAGPLLDLVPRERTAPADTAMALYLEGVGQRQAGRLDDALKSWDEVAALNDPPSRARALYATALARLDAQRASRADSIKALDALRFAWRGDGFEFTLLRKLGELQLAEGDQGAALESMHQAAMNFPDIQAAKDVAKQSGDAFAALFLGANGDDLPPLKALALYDEFHDLEPVGERRDAIVKKLIDRLVAVDLLDRAAGLLEDQVTHRLTGVGKTRGATQLALLRLMDHEPDTALKALDIDVGRDVPPDLARQRQQLRARVLLESNHPADALALIANDQTRDADRLRADIYWHGHDWRAAAQTLGRLAGTPSADGKIDAETGRIVVSLAAALTLDDDQDALAKLRANFGPAMAASRYADAFRVLAGNGSSATGADPKTIATQVAQIGELQGFMAAYKERLASSTKSATVN